VGDSTAPLVTPHRVFFTSGTGTSLGMQLTTL